MNIPITYNELLMTIQWIAKIINRDIEKFKLYNIDENYINNLLIKHDELNEINMISTELSQTYGMTEQLNGIVSQIIHIIQDIQLRVRLQFGKNSMEIQNFKVSNIYHLSKSQLIPEFSRIIKNAVNIKEELNYVGLQPEKLEDYKNILEKYETLLNDREIQKNKRKQFTLAKKQLASEIYEMVQEISRIGKFMWKNESPAKAEQYTIKKLVFSHKNNKKGRGEAEE